MIETLLVLLLLTPFALIGYYILPWIIDGISPRETWKSDRAFRKGGYYIPKSRNNRNGT